VAETEGSKNLVLLDARDNISRAMMELRDMAKGMSSERIKVLGLLGSVEQEADRIRRAGLCEVTIQSQGAPIQLEHQKETILFRVIQECLQNIIKHAQAKRIQLLFLYTESTVAISVDDDGKGFLITRENNLSGLGFMNIHHRIELMSGKVVVQSEPGSGTKILIEVPLG
jgi:signal transduction histidine kinase